MQGPGNWSMGYEIYLHRDKHIDFRRHTAVLTYGTGKRIASVVSGACMQSKEDRTKGGHHE